MWVRLTISLPSVSQMGREFGILDISQLYRFPFPITGDSFIFVMYIVFPRCSLNTVEYHFISTTLHRTFMVIVLSVVIYWFKRLHLYTIFPSHLYLKSDVWKIFQLDLNAPLPTPVLLPSIICEKPLGLLRMNSRHPQRAIETACGTHNMHRKWLGLWQLP
jgi:hypothetical protein